MRLSSCILVIILANILFSHPSANSIAGELIWGKNIGPVSAYVGQIDHAKGLTIRSAPSKVGQIVGYIPLGTKIRGSSEFKNGWVKLVSPVDNGWVSIDSLKPRPIAGMVKKVDSAELCLPIRAGPAPSYQKIGCAQIGESLNLTGVMTADNWFQLSDRRGWVEASSVQLPVESAQAVVANGGTPSGASAKQAVSPSNGKAIGPPAPSKRLTEKGSVSKKAPATPPLTSTASAPAATPPPKAAPVKKELPHVACKGGWCVNFDNSQVTHEGKRVSGIKCFKNDVCANIVAQHYVAQATADGTATFGKFKLLPDGVILDSKSTKLLAYCNAKGSIDQKCVVNFLRKRVGDISWKNSTGSVSGKGQASKEKIKKTTENSSESKKRRSSTAAPKLLKDFDRDACYSKCPCAMTAGEACANCKQRCDDEYWKNFAEKSK
jgi:uncharacterized protein YraI